MANVTTPDSQTITIQPFDKSMIADIEQAIVNAQLGFNPSNNGEKVIINVPALTEERRKELARVVKDEAENSKIAIRNIRRDAISDFRELLKEKEISEDESHRAEEDMQKITDQHIDLIDKSLNDKENSLLEIYLPLRAYTIYIFLPPICTEFSPISYFRSHII